MPRVPNEWMRNMEEKAKTTKPRPKTPTKAEIEAELVALQGNKPARLVLTKIESMGEYEEIAKSLGYFPKELNGIAVKNFCVENDIPIYDMEQVKTYMDKMLKLEKQIRKEPHLQWFWKGLSKNDKLFGRYDYDKAVPLYILKRVKLLKDRFKEDISFAVSDYEVVDPDPFILGNYQGYCFVFGVWDEPGF